MNESYHRVLRVVKSQNRTAEQGGQIVRNVKTDGEGLAEEKQRGYNPRN